ncbi:MAG: hypothetical protein KGV56_00515 [Gammaproteobacteria bacterium]|nr:hypothetical protein [Gammaproteobacteria bacterium]
MTKRKENYSKDRIIVHPKKGMRMEIQANWWIKFCIGMGILFLCATPLLLVVGWFFIA